MNIDQFIQEIPKAELHLHIEGTLEPKLMFELSKKNNVKIRFNNIEEIKKAYQFENLQSFLNIYYEGTKVLVKEENFYELTWQYLKKAKEENICHTEIFFDPQTHINNGISFKTVIEGIHKALIDGEKKLNISSKLIMCFLRDLTQESAFETLELALPYKDWIIAIGLDSAEVGHPPEKFKSVFKKAKELGFLTVAHAGEEGPSEYIYQSLDILNVSRIDHGVGCINDIPLMKRLSKEKTPLTTCPLSNLKLKVYEQLKDHPLKKLLENDLCVTINSDDPAYFGGYINENYLQCQQHLNLNKKDIYQLARNSFEASFLSDKEKQKYFDKLDKFYRDFK